MRRVGERAVGAEVMESLTPGQQVLKIVYEELTELLGGEGAPRLAVPPRPPLVVLLVGLQGSGKTTTAAKLALHLRRRGQRPLLVAADLARPAAAEQLRRLGEKVGVDVFRGGAETPEEVARAGLREARRLGADAVVVDSAGRLTRDEALMQEIRRVHEAAAPHETLLVLDAMTGQDAVATAAGFQEAVPLTGAILAKLDGDARGGAALSLRAAVGLSIRFVGTGERPEDLEPFHPERMASRILGLGDVRSLFERAEALDRRRAEEVVRKVREDRFTLEDFLAQMQEVRRLGRLDELLALLPGLRRRPAPEAAVPDERAWRRSEAVIRSMTPEERRRPEILDASRKRRIARGAGVGVEEVNRLLRQFEEARRLMAAMVRGGAPAPAFGGGARRPGRRRR